MRILICVKQVPDTTEVRLSSDLTLQRDFVAQVLNPADESALELGLSLRDAHGGTSTVLTMGKPAAESMLRECLSRGADEAVLLTDSAFAGSDTLATARALAAAAKYLGGFDLILCGRRATDGETGQVGPMVAQMLDIPCVPNVTKAVLALDGLFSVRQLTEDGVKEWRAELPALITLCEWSYALRLPTITGLKRARQAAVRRLTVSEIGLEPAACGLRGSPTRVIHVDSRPVGVRPCQKLALDELLGSPAWLLAVEGEAKP